MKIKKIISAVLATTMIATMSMSAFAATWTPDPVNTYPTANGQEEIPMYGYVGPVVTNPTDPDPDDPGTNPWTALNISVPVKFIWAAFDNGALTGTAVDSPEYKIINNSQKDVTVTVTDFATTNPLAAADGAVTLDFAKTTAGTSSDNMAASATLDNITSATPATAQVLGVIDGLDTVQIGTPSATSGETWTFTIGGTYTPNGAWPSTLKTPEYKVTFNFALV